MQKTRDPYHSCFAHMEQFFDFNGHVNSNKTVSVSGCWNRVVFSCLEHTPQRFNIAPKNRQFQKETHLPTIIFQGRAVKFRGCIVIVEEFRTFWGVMKHDDLKCCCLKNQCVDLKVDLASNYVHLEKGYCNALDSVTHLS